MVITETWLFMFRQIALQGLRSLPRETVLQGLRSLLRETVL
ncbi:MAG: hypothetical protein ACLQUW_13760 [Desulfobaccales bacterium]